MPVLYYVPFTSVNLTLWLDVIWSWGNGHMNSFLSCPFASANYWSYIGKGYLWLMSCYGVKISVNFVDEDYDEKYSSTNLFHGRKLNKTKWKVRYDDEDCDEISAVKVNALIL